MQSEGRRTHTHTCTLACIQTHTQGFCGVSHGVGWAASPTCETELHKTVQVAPTGDGGQRTSSPVITTARSIYGVDGGTVHKLTSMVYFFTGKVALLCGWETVELNISTQPFKTLIHNM